MVDLTQAHKASIELLGTRHTALVEAVRNYVNGSVQPSIDELIAAIEDVTTDIDTKEKMLLGLASRQATKPVPSLILDFKTRHYLQGARRPEKGYGIHDLLTVERATPKWVYSASGRLTEVPANEPAYQHDPVTGEPLGLLIEESRTNLLLRSEDLDRSVWSKSTAITFSDSMDIGPIEGGATPQTVSISELADLGFLYQTVGVTATTRYSTTSLIRLLNISESDLIVAFFDATNNSFITQDASKKIRHVGGGYIEVTSGVVTPAECTELRFYVHRGSMPPGDVFVHAGSQLEEAPAPSSYIPTTDSPVTRAADNVSRVLGDEFNPSEFTIHGDFVFTSVVGFQRVFQLDDDSNNLKDGTMLNIRRSSSSANFVIDITDAGEALTTEQVGSIPINENHKYALSYNGDNVVLFIDGFEKANFSYPLESGSFSRLRFYHWGGEAQVGGVVASNYILPRAITETELQELTTL